MPFSFKVKPSGLPPEDLDTQKFLLLNVVLLLTHSEFSCLAQVAKPYPVSDPTYLPKILNLLHCISNCAHEMLITILRSRLLKLYLCDHAMFVS